MSLSLAPVLTADPPSLSKERAVTDTDRQTHITALDGIRGIAIIAVLVHHLFAFDVRNVVWIDTVYRFLSMGWIGVDLFFVLSGFLITGILIESRDKASFFVRFYGRRAVRIFPLYYGLLIVGLLAGQLGHGQIWLWTYLTNLQIALANDWVQQTTSWLKVWQFWSLAVEEHFYLLWPVIVFLCPPRRLMHLSIALAILCCGSRCIFVFATGRTLTAYVLTPFRIDGLLVGAACATAMRSGRRRELLSTIAMPTLGICTALVLASYALTGWNPASTFVASFGYALLAVAFASLIVAALTRNSNHWLRRLTELRILRFFGKYSYGIYAFHTTVFVLLLPVVAAVMWHLVHSRTLASLLAKPVAVAVTVLMAMLSWHLYEKHWLKLKAYLGGTPKLPNATD